MRVLLIAAIALLNGGCVAWQSSIDDIRTSQAAFRAEVNRTIVQLADKADAGDVSEALEKLTDASATAERELLEIRRENEETTRSIAAESVKAIANHFGVPTGGNLAAAIIKTGGGVTDAELADGLDGAMDEFENTRGSPLSDTQRGGIGLAGLMGMMAYRNYTRKREGLTKT